MHRRRRFAGRGPIARLDACAPVGHSRRVATRDWKRLGQRVRNRRMQLGYTRQADLAAAGGPSERTISSLETGNPVKDWQLDKLDLVLRWAPGSCQSVLVGGEPEELKATESQPAPTPTVEEAEVIARFLDAGLEELFDMCRTVAADPEYGAAGAEQWLLRVLKLRDSVRQRKEATSRHVS